MCSHSLSLSPVFKLYLAFVKTPCSLQTKISSLYSMLATHQPQHCKWSDHAVEYVLWVNGKIAFKGSTDYARLFKGSFKGRWPSGDNLFCLQPQLCSFPLQFMVQQGMWLNLSYLICYCQDTIYNRSDFPWQERDLCWGYARLRSLLLPLLLWGWGW